MPVAKGRPGERLVILLPRLGEAARHGVGEFRAQCPVIGVVGAVVRRRTSIRSAWADRLPRLAEPLVLGRVGVEALPPLRVRVPVVGARDKAAGAGAEPIGRAELTAGQDGATILDGDGEDLGLESGFQPEFVPDGGDPEITWRRPHTGWRRFLHIETGRVRDAVDLGLSLAVEPLITYYAVAVGMGASHDGGVSHRGLR